MGQSLVKFYVHIIFHTKTHSVLIRDEDRKELYAYMGGIIKDNESIPLLINGTSDHVHILALLSKNIALSKLVEEVKRHSSRWIKTKGVYYRGFAWQGGYSAFSVSQSVVDKTLKYIENQEIHHQKISYKDELKKFLIEYRIEYNADYLFRD